MQIKSLNLNITNCNWHNYSYKPTVFYINLESNHARRIQLESHLQDVGLSYHRVNALKPSDIYVPPDVLSTYLTNDCKFHTSMNIPAKQSLNPSSNLYNYSSVVLGLCSGRHNRNSNHTLTELAVVASHLKAIRTAIYHDLDNPLSQNILLENSFFSYSTIKMSVLTRFEDRYALIIEDDVSFPLNIDFYQLIKSAPSDFEVLQLMNTRQLTLDSLYKRYKSDSNFIWYKYTHIFKRLTYGACAYIIDKVRLKYKIDKIIYQHNGWLKYQIIPSSVVTINDTKRCFPKECCKLTRRKYYIRKERIVCIPTPLGYNSDEFIYKMAKTYALTMVNSCLLSDCMIFNSYYVMYLYIAYHDEWTGL